MAAMDGIIPVLVAFCGGILGAALGGLNAFILCGLASIVGTILTMVTGNATFNQIVTWGPFLGPHVAFAGGVVAAAYAARMGKLCSGRNVLVALFGFNDPGILAVGGAFGAFGYLIKWGLDAIPDIGSFAWTNTIALSIVITTAIGRWAFGRTGLLGRVPQGRSRWRLSRDEAWQPWPSGPFQVLLIGVGVSLPVAYSVQALPASTGLFFGFGALSLLFFQFGAKIPVILHIALSAEFLTLATGHAGWGLVFGVLAAFLTEWLACVFLIHGDTHIDPPAMSLVVIFTIYPVCRVTGIFSLTGIMPYLFACIMCITGVYLLHRLQKVS